MNPIRSLFVGLSRMPPAVMLLLIVGLAVVVTMVVTGNLTDVQRRAQERERALKALYESKSNVVCTIKDIPQGEPITAASIQEKQELVSKIPMGAVTSSAAVVGRVAKFPISAGQILADRDLIGVAQAAGLESLLKPGFQAVTLDVGPDTGVAGFIDPGSRVDIYATAGSESKSKAGAILSDCAVVAVDKDYGQTPEKPTTGKQPTEPPPPGGMANRGIGSNADSTKHITLQLEPKDIQRLLKGIQSTSGASHGVGGAGKLYLTLRGFDDHTPVPILDIGNLFAKPTSTLAFAKLPPPPAPVMPSGPILPPMHQIEMWSGDHKDMISVPQT
jgi:pilus assembly protein CpaB